VLRGSSCGAIYGARVKSPRISCGATPQAELGPTGNIKNISPQTPAILFSGKVKVYERDMRADVFMPKGMYAPVELLERIRLLLIRKRGPKRVVPSTTSRSSQAAATAS